MTQLDRILRALRKGPVNTTDFQAPTCDGGSPILRVAARMHDLTEQGYGLRTERQSNGTTTYYLTRDLGRGDETTEATPERARPTIVAAPSTRSLFDADIFGRPPDFRDVA